jgi:hypothetical protein
MDGRRVPDDVRADTLGADRRNAARRLSRAAPNEGIDSKTRQSLAAPVDEDGILAAAPSDKRSEDAHRRGPQRAEARLEHTGAGTRVRDDAELGRKYDLVATALEEMTGELR